MTDNIGDENNEVATVRKRKHKHVVLPGEENEVTEPVKKKKEQAKNNSEKQSYPVPPRTTSPTSSMFEVQKGCNFQLCVLSAIIRAKIYPRLHIDDLTDSDSQDAELGIVD
ncbi:hypothetical protein FQR65_LT17528 [Abscondita terminalis]|nr:hypothetical protein FQR65_LT17528 [Abscondita terminalis]